MGGWVWGGRGIGLVIVALAVGIPFFLTHRCVREPRDVSDSRAYLRERRLRDVAAAAYFCLVAARSDEAGPPVTTKHLAGEISVGSH